MEDKIVWWRVWRIAGKTEELVCLCSTLDAAKRYVENIPYAHKFEYRLVKEAATP